MWVGGRRTHNSCFGVRHDFGLEERAGGRCGSATGRVTFQDARTSSAAKIHQAPRSAANPALTPTINRGLKNPTCGKFIWVGHSSRYPHAATTGRWTGSE
jgi:hypothetical protein